MTLQSNMRVYFFYQHLIFLLSYLIMVHSFGANKVLNWHSNSKICSENKKCQTSQENPLNWHTKKQNFQISIIYVPSHLYFFVKKGKQSYSNRTHIFYLVGQLINVFVISIVDKFECTPVLSQLEYQFPFWRNKHISSKMGLL